MLAFWLTCLLEAPWWLCCLHAEPSEARRPASHRTLIALGLTGVLNLLTHPVVWRVTAGGTATTWLLAELAAVLVEVSVAAVVLHRWGVRHPLVTAGLYGIGANATSALVGVLFF